MAEIKERVVSGKVTDLWSEDVKSTPIRKFVKDVGDSEKMLIFSETGAGKTTFYLGILKYLEKKGVKKEDLRMFIVFPDRPNGLAKLYGLIPKEYIDCIDVFTVRNYEETVRATASAERALMEHYRNTGVHGWLVFELMENYWTFAQDYFCRMAYGQTISEYFTQMQSIMSKDKAEKKTAYEAFAGPFGGPWPIIKFSHNFNWIDKVKRMPFNVVFTSELKEEENQDSIFKSLGYRPAGEKHTQHKVDTILYLSHKQDNFFMKPFKLTGFTKLYGELKVSDTVAYEEHRKAIRRLSELGCSVTKMKDLEIQAGIKPPKKPSLKEESKPEEKVKEKVEEKKEETSEIDYSM